VEGKDLAQDIEVNRNLVARASQVITKIHQRGDELIDETFSNRQSKKN
jgi:hypothetical protein